MNVSKTQWHLEIKAHPSTYWYKEVLASVRQLDLTLLINSVTGKERRICPPANEKAMESKLSLIQYIHFLEPWLSCLWSLFALYFCWFFFSPFSFPKIVIKMMWQFLMWNTGSVQRQRLRRAEIYVLCIPLTLKSFCSRAVTWSLLCEMLSIPGKLSALNPSPEKSQ